MHKKISFLFISVFSFLAFILFSYVVAKEIFVQIDFDTTVKFQDRIPRRLDLPFSILSIIGSVEITGLIWLFLTVFMLIKRYFWAAIALFLFWFAHIFELFGKTYVLHPAPPHLFYRGSVDFNFPSHYVQSDFSYPSGHMLRTTFLASFLFMYIFFKTEKTHKFLSLIALIIFVGLMMVSRVYLAEHWTSDVIGGSLLGASTGIFASIWLPLKKSD